MDHFRFFEGLSFSVAVWGVQMISYHGFALWFEWLDRTGRGQAFKVRTVERMSYREMLPRVLFNQTFVLLPAMGITQALGLAYYGSTQITIMGFVASVIGLTIGHDIVQYIAHRIVLHEPTNMRKFGHALHHTTRASRAISACYMSAEDFFLEIVCPYLIPLILIGGGGTNFIFHALIVSAGAFGGVDNGHDLTVSEAASRCDEHRLVLALFEDSAESLFELRKGNILLVHRNPLICRVLEHNLAQLWLRGIRCLRFCRQVDIKTTLVKRQGCHEDNEQHKQHVDHWRDVRQGEP